MNVLSILPGFAPTTIINIITPLNFLHQQGKIKSVIRMEWEVTPGEVAAADVVVFCRNSNPDYAPIRALVSSLGIPFIFDLDDHVLAAPVESETHRYFSQSGRREEFESYLHHAALVRVHSPMLQQIVAPYNMNHKLVWSAIDWSLVPAELPPLRHDPLRIVYASQKETGVKLFPLMFADLRLVLDTYGEQVHLHFLGYNPPEFKHHPRVTFEPFELDYAHYFSRFTRAGYAIGVAPMIDDAFHNSKTNIKFKDYAAAGAAGIYANTPLYNGNGVIDGQTGLLVSGELGSWFPAIQRLIEEPALLNIIRHNARRYAETHYQMDVVGDMWLNDFRSLPPRPVLTTAQQAEIAHLKWWFTKTPSPNAKTISALRKLLKRAIPSGWKQKYYQLNHRLQKLRG